jgi:small nuclear ribonucleoprotein (snRNP)-like protein
MIRKTFAMMLAGLVLFTAFGFQHVRANSVEQQQAADKIRAKVQKIGVGGNAKVEVKLRDGSQLKGRISEADQNTFTIVDSNGGADTVAYADTTSVKKPGGGISTKTLIILGAVAAGTVATWVIVKPALCDGGAQTRGPC